MIFTAKQEMLMNDTAAAFEALMKLYALDQLNNDMFDSILNNIRYDYQKRMTDLNMTLKETQEY